MVMEDPKKMCNLFKTGVAKIKPKQSASGKQRASLFFSCLRAFFFIASAVIDMEFDTQRFLFL